MFVFIVYGKDGYGGSEVAKVFPDDRSAIKYVIGHIFGSNEFYANQTRAENESCAMEHIHRHYVEGT